MRTRTYYWPNEKNPSIEMEVTRDGFVFSALAYSPDLDCWLDCTQGIKERPVWTRKAEQFAADEDWSDQGDSCLEEFKSAIAPMLGVKHA